MRVLTVRPPYSDAIAHYGKTVENRSWRTKYRGPVAILAGRSYAGAAARRAVERISGQRLPERLHGGAVVALVDLVDVHDGGPCRNSPGGKCSPWADVPHDSDFHWVLENVRPLVSPYGLLGSLGLRVATPDVEADILARVA
jgi:hypothetical protein